jgi:methyltransferase (TIGR00027 family)
MKMTISKTAFGVAYHRYAHLVFDRNPRILNDDIIEKMLNPDIKNRILSEKDAWLHPLAAGLRTNVLVRSRFAEDEIEQSIRSGISSIVILGAGLDTCSLRLGLRYPDVQFTEIDQEDTQSLKIRLLRSAEVVIPHNMRFVPLDFEKQNLKDCLRENGVLESQKVFFSWLGVTMYLTRDAILNTLLICGSFAAGSRIVLTFSNSESVSSVIELLAEEAGEVWLSKFTEDEMMQLITLAGFHYVRIVTPREMNDLYFEHRDDSLKCPSKAFIAVAAV